MKEHEILKQAIEKVFKRSGVDPDSLEGQKLAQEMETDNRVLYDKGFLSRLYGEDLSDASPVQLAIRSANAQSMEMGNQRRQKLQDELDKGFSMEEAVKRAGFEEIVYDINIEPNDDNDHPDTDDPEMANE